jgi:Kef-type K+ transport system membrane component KefB
MNAIHVLAEHSVFLLLVQFAVILALARFLGDLARRMGQPQVLGELLAGILLSPSVLGRWWPAAGHFLFPSDVLSMNLLELVSWLGMVYLLFITGLETDLKVLANLGRSATLVAASALIIPFASGVLLGRQLPPEFMGALQNRVVFVLFLGVALGVTAVPVLSKILMDLGMMKRDLGVVLLGAGIVEDIVGWILFSVIINLAHYGHVDAWVIARSVGSTILFLIGSLTVGSFLVQLLFRWVDDWSRMPFRRITLATCLALLFSALTQWIGIHAVFGAFISGILVGRSPRFRARDREIVEGFTLGIVAPVFFSFAGLQVNLRDLQHWHVLAWVLGVATAGKLIGAYIGGRLGKFSRLLSLAIGIGMNTRGAMELVLAIAGYSAGIISSAMFSIIVVVAVVTSVMTPPLLRLASHFIPLTEQEVERFEREQAEAAATFKTRDFKMLLCSNGGPNALAMLSFAAPLARATQSSLRWLMIRQPGRSTGQKFLKLLRRDPESRVLKIEADAIDQTAQSLGVTLDSKLATSETPSDVIIDEIRSNYQLILMGARLAGDPFAGAVLGPVVEESPLPVALMRAAPDFASRPFKRLLLPAKGDMLFPMCLQLAILYMSGVPDASLTVAYADWAPGRDRFQAAQKSQDLIAHMQTMIQEASQVHGVEGQALRIEQKTLEGAHPLDVLLTEARAGYDLLLLGATRHFTSERLFFGHTVEELTRRAPCSVLVLTPRQGGMI